MESKKINQLATAVSPSTSDLAIIGDPVTGVSKKITWLQVSTLIGTAANLQQVTDNGATTTNPVTIGGLTITGLSTGVLKSDSGVISSVPFGAANGVATLAGDGKVPSNQLPSYVDDVVEVANYAALPVTGETGKIYITLDNNKVYRWGGSVYVEIAANNAIWGSITGTLANQTDLQNALNLKANDSLVVHLAGTETITGTKTFSNASKNDGGILLQNGSSYSLSGYMNLGGMTDGLRFTSGGGISNYFALPSSVGYTYTFPAISGTIVAISGGNSTQYIDGTGALQTFPTLVSSDKLVKLVRNQSGATMTAGTIVYISGATGNKPLITKALATGDSTSAQTYGLVQANIANNADGYVVVIGNITDIDTSALTEGQQLYLSGTTAGAYTTTKPYAPIHLVYIGIVLRSHPTQGIIGVKIQNGYEMDELHNVDAYAPSNNDILSYNTTTSLWEHKQIATTLGFTPISLASLSATSPLIYNNGTGAFSIQVATASQNGYLSSTDWSTFNNKQAALGGTGFVKITGSTISYDNSTYYLASNPSAYITLASLSAGDGISYSNTTGVISSTITQYTDALARAAFSESVVGLDYSSSTGVLSTTTGYAIPTTAKQTNWDTAYNDSIISAEVSGTTTKTLTLTQQDAGTITASWTDINTDAVSSVFGRTGAVIAVSGDYNTDQVTEGVTNLYYTNSRSRLALSFVAGSGAYNSTTGVITIPTNNTQITNGAGYITGNQTITLSGDVSGSGATAITTTIGALKVTNAMLAGSIDLTTKVTGLLPDANISSAATWNAKQAALNGTGFVKATGTTITYDNSTYVTTTTAQTISGAKTFSASPIIDGGFATAIPLRFKQYDSASFNSDGYTDLYVMNAYRFGFAFNQGSSNYKGFTFNVNGITLNTSREYTMPDAAGTLALTSNIPTNNNQLTNGAGYITSYTETDTLSSVVARGATTNDTISVGNASLGTTGINIRRGRLSFSSSYEANHSIFNNYLNLDGLGVWDGMKMETYLGLDIKTGGAGTSTTIIEVRPAGVIITGNVSATNLSGTNTGDQTLAGLGGVPTSRTLTINGTAFDLTANRSWTITGTSQWTTSGANIYYDVSGGNVSIGTSASTNKFLVIGSNSGTQTTTQPISKFVNTGNAFSKIVLGSDNSNYDGVVSMDNNATLSSCKLRFYIGNGTGSTAGHSNDHLVITGNGSIGFGTDSPVVHSNVRGFVIKGSSGQRGIMELWDGTSGKSVFQNVGGNTYIGQLDKGTGSGNTYLLVNGSGTSADVALTLNADTTAVFNSTIQGTKLGLGAVASSKLTIYDGDIRLYKPHVIGGGESWKSYIIWTDEVDRLGARIVGERTAWDGAPMGLGFDTGGVGSVTRRMSIASNGVIDVREYMTIGTNISSTQYNVLSENQLYRTGGGDLYINNSGSGHVRMVEGGGSLLINTGTKWNQERFGIQISNAAAWASVPAMMRLTNYGSGYRTKITFTDSSIIDGNLGMIPVGGNASYFVMGFSGATEECFKVYQNGNVVATGDVTAYSDARLKTNVQTIDNALNKILSMRGVTYNRIDTQQDKTKIGLIAQEVKNVIPEVVDMDNEGMYSVSYGNIVAVLIEAVKNQQEQINDLKKQLV